MIEIPILNTSGAEVGKFQLDETLLGTTVRPALYIACGISGAVQHRAGMQESAKILAINSDKEAPIFGIAHYGIVGDMNDVIPKLIKAIRGGSSVQKAATAAGA